jgi:hypothetical protein
MVAQRAPACWVSVAVTRTLASYQYDRPPLKDDSMEIFGLGACLLHGPLGAAMRRGIASSSFSRIPGGVLPSAYSIDEAIQVVRFVGGDIAIPPELRPFCSIPLAMDPQAVPGGGLKSADVVILEINSQVRLTYRGLCLVRSEIMGRIFEPLRAMRPDIVDAVNKWYYRGLLSCEEPTRQAASEALASCVPNHWENAELLRSILRETRGFIRDVEGLEQGIAALLGLIEGAPVGIMTYTHQYTPDGRPMPWPPDFVEQQIVAATKLGLPYFQPSRVVEQVGMTQALQADRVHYRDEFQFVMGEVLAEFAHHVSSAAVAARAA